MSERTVRDLTGLLYRAAHTLDQRLSAALAEVGTSPRAICVLEHALEAERTQGQLAALADLDKTTMVTLMDDLERAGLAERRPSATDRRARIVTVTAAGKELLARGVEVVDRVHGEALADLPAPGRAVLEAALDGLGDDGRARPGGPRRPRRA